MRAALSSGGGGCAAKSCDSSAGADTLPAAVWDKIKESSLLQRGGAPLFRHACTWRWPRHCNIQCHYCNRKYDCTNESRPGVVSERLTLDQARRKVIAVANEVPQLSVLGIAGPGDALYDFKKTFQLVAKTLPDIKLCLSTNGLALPDHVDTIADMNIDHVTITINMVDPEIGERIYPWIYYRHRRWIGREAARILHERQMEGLEMLTARGILVKVNSVMIPGVNDEHLKTVNAEIKRRGAFLHNIMPLISDPAHGTHYGLTGQRGPRPAKLKALQDELEGDARLMRHCRQCRADAVGLLGEDRGQEFTLDQLPEEVSYDPEKRSIYRAFVAEARAEHDQAKAEAMLQLAAAEVAPALLVAVCTKGGGRVNQHFGHAREFQIYEVDGAGVRFVGHRKAESYCQGGHGEDDALEVVIAALEGVDQVLCAKIGTCPKDRLEEAGIAASDAFAFEHIETAVAALYAARHAAPAALPLSA